VVGGRIGRGGMEARVDEDLLRLGLDQIRGDRKADVAVHLVPLAPDPGG
jgi:hypothetical protein